MCNSLVKIGPVTSEFKRAKFENFAATWDCDPDHFNSLTTFTPITVTAGPKVTIEH